MRNSPIFIGMIGQLLEGMQDPKASTVSLEGEHRAVARSTAIHCRPIQRASRQHQLGKRIGSGVVRVDAGGIRADRSKVVQGPKTRAIDIDFENRATSGAAASKGR